MKGKGVYATPHARGNDDINANQIDSDRLAPRGLHNASLCSGIPKKGKQPLTTSRDVD